MKLKKYTDEMIDISILRLKNKLKELNKFKKKNIKARINTFSIKINLKNLPDDYLTSFRNLKIHGSDKLNNKIAYVYFFEQLGDFKRKYLIKKFEKYRPKAAKDGGRSCSLIPRDAINNPSKYLYIGSMKKGITGRIRQHLGYGGIGKGKGTFALQLKHWFPEEIVLIHFLEIKNSELSEDLEHALAEKLKPCFGKH